jgi:transcriptional antiterminator RfaH
MPNLQTSHFQSWYAVHCKPRKEWLAATALESLLGLTIYLPQVCRYGHGQFDRTPFFSRYLFLWVDLQTTALSTINAAPGVSRLVTFGERPQPVPITVIEAIRDVVDDLNAQGGLPEHPFHFGDTVRLTDGPLCWLEAKFIKSMKSSGRVRILIDFLGQLREAEVDADRLEPAQVEPNPRRERRTRGKGRKIKVNS